MIACSAVILSAKTSWMVCSASVMPRWSARFGAEKFASTMRTFLLNSCAITVPKLTTVVVLPTPPLIEIMPIMLPMFLFFIVGENGEYKCS